jgi:tRNA threonylcarbamoyl adenosine modification protein (Sua5/YciO/YrdC/YwlC family)
MTASKSDVDAARQALRQGGIVVYPTNTLYGLGCLADREHAVQRLLELADRPPGKGVSAVFASLDRARAWSVWTDTAEQLARAFLPGPLTVVLAASPKAPRGIQAEQGTVAIRHVDRETTLRLAEVGPVVATSANPAGETPPATIAEAREYFGDEVDAYVDAGRLEGPSSTVVDAREAPGTVIREGPISEDEIQEATTLGA